MASEKPERNRNYRSRDLNIVFAISSMVLTVTVVLMIVDDYSREWKDIQRDFNSQETRRTHQDIQEAEKELASSDLKQLRTQLQEADAELGQKGEEYREALGRLDALDADLYGRDMDFRFAKANYDSKKYEIEKEIDHLRQQERLDEVAKLEGELQGIKETMDEAKVHFDAVTAEQKAAKGEVDNLSKRVEDTRSEISKLYATRERLERKLAGVESNLATWLVNAPMLDFLAPTLTVQQVVLPNLRHDINFMEIPRVDRCMTCHTAIDVPGYEDGPQPFRTHPQLDLFLDPGSKHPMESFGCTVCHGGRDRGTSFTSAAHTPDNEAQRKEWEQKYDWHSMHYWETPMRPSSHYYSGCYQCHSGQAQIPNAEPLDHGLKLVERAGCYACHKIEGFEKRRRVGPDLAHIPSKTDRDWASRWILEPRKFRADARMPSFFQQSNQQAATSGDKPSDAELNQAEIDSIVTYIWDSAEPLQYDPISGKGNMERGRNLVRTIGCYGCHTDDPDEKFESRAHERAFGPNLAGLGSKTNRDWLYHWLRKPQHYWEDTYMPDLRLTHQEALDITDYLLSTRNEDFEAMPVPAVGVETLDWLTLEYLSSRASLAKASEQLAEMSEHDKKMYLGEKMINKYGCFGCHNIKGFENAQPIGTELTEEGSKLLTRLDFGLEEETLEHSHQAWFTAKLQNPRLFDRGKIKTWDEKLKMPNFHFNEQEIQALVGVILGWTKSEMDADMRYQLTGDRNAIEKGRQLVRDRNCTGCHIFNQQGGAIRDTIEDPGYFPPAIDGEGEKVIPFWLFNFIKAPSTIRPWLNARMPSFHMNDGEVVTISQMFAYTDKVPYPFRSEYQQLPSESPELLAAGRKLFTDFKCLQCHITGAGKPEREAADLAPNLSLARERLRPSWIEKWLRDPQLLQPGTRMPGYFPDGLSPDPKTLGGDAARQMRALSYHVLGLARQAPAAGSRTE